MAGNMTVHRTISIYALLIGLAGVAGFAPVPEGRTNACPVCTMNEAANFACGASLESDNFCYSRGFKATCDLYAASCETAPTSSACSRYETYVNVGQCPALAVGSLSTFCQTLGSYTNLRDQTPPSWCGGADEEVCQQSYLTYDVGGEEAFQRCYWDSANKKCKSYKSEDRAYNVVQFCNAICKDDIKATRTLLTGSETCNSGSWNNDGGLIDRITDVTSCESAYYVASDVEYPCTWYKGTDDCSAEVLGDWILDDNALATCACAAEQPGCSTKPEYCCGRDDSMTTTTCEDCLALGASLPVFVEA